MGWGGQWFKVGNIMSQTSIYPITSLGFLFLLVPGIAYESMPIQTDLSLLPVTDEQNI